MNKITLFVTHTQFTDHKGETSTTFHSSFDITRDTFSTDRKKMKFFVSKYLCFWQAIVSFLNGLLYFVNIFITQGV